VYLGVYAFSLLGLITCSLADESRLGSRAIAVNRQVQGGILLVVLLNLGGTPPFMGFFAKVLVIRLLARNMEILVVVRLISGSVILLFVYLRMFLRAVTSTGSGGLLQIGMPYPANR
jgi:NADH:ubiquinone oxidoreductase subunit 2 (subunit N)